MRLILIDDKYIIIQALIVIRYFGFIHIMLELSVKSHSQLKNYTNGKKSIDIEKNRNIFETNEALKRKNLQPEYLSEGDYKNMHSFGVIQSMLINPFKMAGVLT